MSLCQFHATLSRRTAVRLGAASLATLAIQGAGSARASNPAPLEANKAIVQRLFDIGVNHGDEAVIMTLYAPDYVDRRSWPRQMPGPAGMPITLQALRAVFPDITVNVDALVAEDNLVAARATWRRTHPPAGTHVVGRTMHIFRLADDLIIEGWSIGWDWLAASPRADL